MQTSKEEKTQAGDNVALISNAITTLGETTSYEVVADALPKLIARGTLCLDLSRYITSPNAQCANRYLLYDNPDKANPLSLWVFAFARRQKTCIHDHKYKGTVMVLQGPISEKFYNPTGNNSAQLVSRIDRHRFHTNEDDLTDTFVHQIKCRKGLGVDSSITLHIYNMEAHVVNQENERMDNRNLNTIFFKDKKAAHLNGAIASLKSATLTT